MNKQNEKQNDQMLVNKLEIFDGKFSAKNLKSYYFR